MHFIQKSSHFFREEVYAVTTPTSVNVSSITSIDIKVNGGSLVLVSSLYSYICASLKFIAKQVLSPIPAFVLNCWVVKQDQVSATQSTSKCSIFLNLIALYVEK